MFGQPLERDYPLADLLRRPEVDYHTLMSLPGAGPGTEDGEVAAQVETQVKYDGYIARQKDEIARQAEYESLEIPEALDYANVRGLSREVQQKLAAQRPRTLGQAGRISGMTPAAISLLLVHLRRGAGRNAAIAGEGA